jgi:hypothetical protein
VETVTWLCLQPGGTTPIGARQRSPRESGEEGSGPVLACAYCRRPITTGAARIEVGGSHAHTFANPDGVRFRIGCFADASGLRAVGAKSPYFTWFAGFSWQVELCARCREQLGWLYESADGLFHGLILDRLVELDERAAP